MPTQAERTALVFLTAVTLAGGVVRLVRAARHGQRPPPAAAAALASQQRSVDSVALARTVTRINTRRNTQTSAEDGSRGARGRGARSANGGLGRGITLRDTVKPPEPAFPIDVDRATAKELEALPRVGPALAARIVADREANGPFGSLEALDLRVKGIGPSLARAIQQYVTFSGR